MKRYPGIIAFVMAVAAVTGCAGEPQEPSQPTQQPAQGGLPSGSEPTTYDLVELTLPGGDADAGRQVFVDLRCTACHRVEGEPDLGEPVSTSVGPDLGPELAAQPLGNLATAIVAPSHAMSIRTSPDTRGQVDGVLSPMGDYSEVMTMRQLLDVLAYLDAVRR